MVIFSTMFYVTKELTKEKLIELAFEWVNNSPHYGFDNISWSGEDLYERETEKHSLICQALFLNFCNSSIFQKLTECFSRDFVH